MRVYFYYWPKSVSFSISFCASWRLCCNGHFYLHSFLRVCFVFVEDSNLFCIKYTLSIHVLLYWNFTSSMSCLRDSHKNKSWCQRNDQPNEFRIIILTYLASFVHQVSHAFSVHTWVYKTLNSFYWKSSRMYMQQCVFLSISINEHIIYFSFV